MLQRDATGTVDFLKEGNRKHYFIRVNVKDWETWPFPSDAFLIHRGKSRNKKFKQGDKVSFKAVEVNGDLRAWKIAKLWPEGD